MARNTINVCMNASVEKFRFALVSTPVILNRTISSSLEAEKPSAIPMTSEQKYKMKFSAVRIRNILFFVRPIN
ncbi:hypothetical protein D3C73_1506580 [compost metagenome]